MKAHFARKALMTLGAVCLLFLLPAETFFWNQATHAYIADRLGARAGHDNLNEMWGSVAPDMYNFVFDPNLCPGWIADQTQGTYAETFLKVWDAAGTNAEEALAYGFVGNNLKDRGIIHNTKAAAEKREATNPDGKKEKTP